MPFKELKNTNTMFLPWIMNHSSCPSSCYLCIISGTNPYSNLLQTIQVEDKNYKFYDLTQLKDDRYGMYCVLVLSDCKSYKLWSISLPASCCGLEYMYRVPYPETTTTGRYPALGWRWTHGPVLCTCSPIPYGLHASFMSRSQVGAIWPTVTNMQNTLSIIIHHS